MLGYCGFNHCTSPSQPERSVRVRPFDHIDRTAAAAATGTDTGTGGGGRNDVSVVLWMIRYHVNIIDL